MKIEKMQKTHLKEAVEISALTFSSPYSEKAFEDELENPSYANFVALNEDKVVGFGGAFSVNDEVYITNIAVKEEYRKKGLGQALLNEIINHFKGLSFISLEVRVSNFPAIKLYEKAGFKSQGIRKNFYSHPVEDANIMTLFLKD